MTTLRINEHENLGGVIEGFVNLIKSVVKETLEETLDERMTKQNYLNQTVTREELCKRWGCCSNTIRNKELDGVITPLQVKCKKKVYSMRDIVEIENRGDFKLVG